MIHRSIKFLLGLAVLLISTSATAQVASAPELPKPVLYLTSTETFQQGKKTFVRYKYDVFNKEAYPVAMFAAAPKLPPCGTNTKASRTWVDIYDQSGKRLNGFCALKKPGDLNLIWFAIEDGIIPPSYVYIELNDRQTGKKYKSNLADTVE